MTYQTSHQTPPAPHSAAVRSGGSRGLALTLPALAELAERPQWVSWLFETDPEHPDAKPRKIPKNPATGGNAMHNTPATWGSFNAAQAAQRQRHHTGLGFVFTADDPYCGIDLDNCIDETDQIKPLAWQIIVALNSYAEISPSGRGVKIYCRGAVSKSLKLGNIGDGVGLEMYDRLRWFAVTGQHVADTPDRINESAAAVTALYDQHRRPDTVWTAPAPAPRIDDYAPPSEEYPQAWVNAIVKRTIDTATGRMAAAQPGNKHHTRCETGMLLGGLIAGLSRIGYGHLLTEHEAATLLYNACPPTANLSAEGDTIVTAIRAGHAKPLAIDPAPEREPQPQPRAPRTTDPYVNMPPDDPPPAPETRQGFHPLLIDAPLTDAGNAECLAALHADILRYCRTTKKWMRWSGARWETDSTSTAWRLMLTTVRERRFTAVHLNDEDRAKRLVKWSYDSENTNKRTASLKAAETLQEFETVIHTYDQDTMLAGTPNGTLDLSSQTLRAARQNDMLTMQIGTPFDGRATCPRWLQFMHEITGNDADMSDYIKRATGYSLTGSTREQKLFLLYGEGRNGKSTFLNILGRLFGDYAGNTAFEMLDAEQRGSNTSDLAALKGKRFVSILESDQDRFLAEARVKVATGKDQIHCRYLYCEPFDYYPHFKIWMAMNHLPRIRGTDEGIWRRIQLIPFLQKFSDTAQDKDLEDKLLLELPGILNWALDGLRDWLANGLGEPTAVKQATADYRNSSDTVGQFLDEATVVEDGAYVDISDLYADFQIWSKNRGEIRPLSQPALGRSLVSRGYASTRKIIGDRKRTIYHGLRQRQESDY